MTEVESPEVEILKRCIYRYFLKKKKEEEEEKASTCSQHYMNRSRNLRRQYNKKVLLQFILRLNKVLPQFILQLNEAETFECYARVVSAELI